MNLILLLRPEVHLIVYGVGKLLRFKRPKLYEKVMEKARKVL
ncbi:MAG: hypothetical protein ACTS6G_04785 [Candidatus Hodgkinia cicadicola]